MRPLKASLFIAYCLAAVVLVGAAFSHVWRTSRLLAKDSLQPVANLPTVAPEKTASVKPIEQEQSQS